MNLNYANNEYRENQDGNLQSINHVMDDTRRIATIREGNDFGDTTPAIKYNLDDHLGSSNVLVDEYGTLVNFEEYYPFGETSFGSYAKKRYRFCGKEKDDESGMYYYGARYYSPWLCRFISVDPLAGKYVFQSSYVYADNNPICKMDYNGEGTEGTPSGGGKGEATNNLSDLKFRKGVDDPGEITKIPLAPPGGDIKTNMVPLGGGGSKTENKSGTPTYTPDKEGSIQFTDPLGKKHKAGGLDLNNIQHNEKGQVTGITTQKGDTYLWDTESNTYLPKVKSTQGSEGGMKPASSYNYSQDAIPGKFADDWNYILNGSDGNLFSRAANLFIRDWNQASTSDKVDLILSAVPLLRIGKIVVPAEKFHRFIKPDILKASGKGFEKIVGRNPDISIDKGQIILRGTGPFKGKSFPTGLDPKDFFH